MANDWREEVEHAREEARIAREEARRLADEARAVARRLANEFRQREREERHQRRDDARQAARGRARPWTDWSPHSAGFAPGPSFRPGADPRFESGPGPRVEREFGLEGVNHVVVDQTAGRLTVRPATEGETPGAVCVGGKSPPRLEVVRDGDRLTVEVKQQTGWLFRRRQGVTTVVRLAREVPSLRVNLGYGDAHVREMAAHSLEVDVGAGTIATFSTRGSLRCNVGAGKIAVNGHAGVADCDTGTGDLLMDVAEVVPGDYRANTGIGRAEIRLPAGAQVHVRAASGIGRTRIEFPSAGPEALTRVRIDAGIGEVSVRTREPGEVPAQPPAASGAQRPSRGAAAASRRREAEELRVLQLLEQGRISSQEAADLIAALQGAAPPIDEQPDDEEPPAEPPQNPTPPEIEPFT